MRQRSCGNGDQGEKAKGDLVPETKRVRPFARGNRSRPQGKKRNKYLLRRGEPWCERQHVYAVKDEERGECRTDGGEQTCPETVYAAPVSREQEHCAASRREPAPDVVQRLASVFWHERYGEKSCNVRRRAPSGTYPAPAREPRVGAPEDCRHANRGEPHPGHEQEMAQRIADAVYGGAPK